MGFARIRYRGLGFGALSHHLADLEGDAASAANKLRRRLDRPAVHAYDRGTLCCFFFSG